MKKITNFKLKKLIIPFLCATIYCSTLFSIACNQRTDSSSNNSSSVAIQQPEKVYPTDTQAIANGDFEFSTFENTDNHFPDSTSISWLRAHDNVVVYADSSWRASGIIDTKAGDPDSLEAYNTMAEKQGFSYTEADGVRTYYNPGTPYNYYFIKENETFSDWPADATTESTDLPTNDDGLPMSGSKILMIHNKALNDGVVGTAQKFTSTTLLSLNTNEYAELSVWVKTYDLSSSFTDKPGAYIAIQNTVSSAAATVMLTNINTNGNWAKYTIYLASSDFTTSSFKVVLGLGTGSKADRSGYVEGYAFFDNVTFKKISLDEYTQATSSLSNDRKISIYNANNDLINDTIKVNQSTVIFTSNLKDGENANESYSTIKYIISHKKSEE